MTPIQRRITKCEAAVTNDFPRPDDDEAAFEAVIEQRMHRGTTDLAALDLKLAELGKERDELQYERAALAEKLGHLRAAIGREEPTADGAEPVEPADVKQSIADMVVALLTEVGRPLHYREIEEELRRRYGVSVGGKDPANTLLARFYQDKRLNRPARGTYVVLEGTRAKR